MKYVLISRQSTTLLILRHFQIAKANPCGQEMTILWEILALPKFHFPDSHLYLTKLTILALEMLERHVI